MGKRLSGGAGLVAIGLMASAAVYFAFPSTQGANAGKTYRIGWESIPPFQVEGPNRTPTGFAVELVREAARRRGIQLEWVFATASAEASLRTGSVDLWPLITITDERKKIFHITDPYLQHEHYLIVRAASPFVQPRDLADATIAHMPAAINRQLMARQLPTTVKKMIEVPELKDGIEAVCSGRADAVFLNEFGATSTLLKGVACNGSPLRMIWLPSLKTQLGVGATFEARAAADEIREEIAAIAQDGNLTPLMTSWDYYLPYHFESMNALLRADRLKWRLIGLIVLFAMLALAAALAANQIRRQRNRIAHEINEREHAEKTLREWERRFRDLLEGAQMVAIIIDLKCGVTFCNEYGLSLVGWTRDELMGRRAEDLLDGDYLRKVTAVSEAANGSLVPVSEGMLVTKTGQKRGIQWTTTILRDTAGHAVGVASLGEDVTELRRLRAEAAERETQERFREIFQEAAIGVAQTDLDGTVTLANDRYCSTLGRAREELVGKNFRLFAHPGDVEHQVAEMNRLLAGEIPSFFMDKRYLRGDGAIVWGRLNGSLIRDHDKQPKQFVFVVEDITKRKNAEAALRESEKRFRNMADTTPVFVWVTGPDSLCTFVNKRWLAFTGRTMEQELGNGWAEGIHRDDVKKCLATYLEAFEARRTFQMEYRLRRADGNYRWVQDEGVPRFGPGGEFAGYIGSCVDVTDLKHAHEAESARQKLEGIGVLARGIAHDFNNLLGSIVADSELARAELSSDSPAGDALERIRLVAVRASEIVRQLMTFTGQESTVLEPVDLPTLVGEMVQLLKISISKLAILKADFPPDLPPVKASPTLLRQVVLNLIVNASEALEDNAGVIAISASPLRLVHPKPVPSGPSLVPGNYVRIVVRDTGRGMTKEIQNRIFEPFFTTKSMGRGLGLATVRGIVQSHGGAIQITSNPGQGCCFEILLPCAELPVPVPFANGAGTVAATFSNTAATVLLVEDEDSLRLPVSAILRKRGLSILEASDGRAAIELFRAKKSEIDVVLLDMNLPGRSGPEVLAEVLRIQPDVKVILTSAYGEAEMMSTVEGMGSWSFIQKPYSPRELGDMLLGACGSAQSSSPAGTFTQR